MAGTLVNPTIPVPARGDAVSWLRGLAARGVTVTVANGRLRMSPPTAYKALTDAELLTLRHYRAAIKAAVSGGVPLDMPAAPSVPELGLSCPYCYSAPCIGSRHPAFCTLHASDPQEQQRLQAEEQARDKHEWDMRRHFRLAPPRWL